MEHEVVYVGISVCWLDSAWTDGLPIKTSCAARSMLGRINATGM